MPKPRNTIFSSHPVSPLLLLTIFTASLFFTLAQAGGEGAGIPCLKENCIV